MTLDEKLKEIEDRRRLMREYLQMKVEEEDWHGVQDAGSDLRDIEAELLGLNFIEE